MSENIHKYFFGQINAPWKNKSPEERLRKYLCLYFAVQDQITSMFTFGVETSWLRRDYIQKKQKQATRIRNTLKQILVEE